MFFCTNNLCIKYCLLHLLGLKIQLESPPWVGIPPVHQHQGNSGTWLGMASDFQWLPGTRRLKAWKRYSSFTSKTFRCFTWGCNQLPLTSSFDVWAPSELMGDGGHLLAAFQSEWRWIYSLFFNSVWFLWETIKGAFWWLAHPYKVEGQV